MKEYIFLFNSDNEILLNFLKDYLSDDVKIKQYGLIGGNEVNYYKSVWVTRDKYKYAYAIMCSPIDDRNKFEASTTTTRHCKEWMENRIKDGAVFRT